MPYLAARSYVVPRCSSLAPCFSSLVPRCSSLVPCFSSLASRFSSLASRCSSLVPSYSRGAETELARRAHMLTSQYAVLTCSTYSHVRTSHSCAPRSYAAAFGSRGSTLSLRLSEVQVRHARRRLWGFVTLRCGCGAIGSLGDKQRYTAVSSRYVVVRSKCAVVSRLALSETSQGDLSQVRSSEK